MRDCAWRFGHLARMILLLALVVRGAGAQGRHPSNRYDDAFRKYSKRNFGPAFDWRIFKAQGMAESNLDAAATSRVGARGVMQLMPATFNEIVSKNSELPLIDDPEMNIAAGIAYDRRLWLRWENDSIGGDCREFVFASYNAGRATMINAQIQARVAGLDPKAWKSIVAVAPKVKRWRQGETLDYLRKIRMHLSNLDDRGRVIEKPAAKPDAKAAEKAPVVRGAKK